MGNKVLYLLVFCAALTSCAPLTRAPVDARESAAEPARGPASRAERSEALLLALMALGVDYRSGGRSAATGFDCSGLVAHVFEEAYGIRLPRTVRGQSEIGLEVTAKELSPGDLVFYDTLGRPYSHVGIYVGEGKFVHAPKSGASVRVESLRSAYWTKRFSGARRIEVPL
ncbi:MAG: C40 family peptidase [Burkholderiales bacterium]